MRGRGRPMRRFPHQTERRAWPVTISRNMRGVRHAVGLTLARAYREGA